MRFILLAFMVVCSLSIFGQQDTISDSNNYTYKVGGKVLIDHSNDRSIVDGGSYVTSGGFQAVRRFGKSKSSLESGIYYMTKAVGTQEQRMIFRNLTIPMNYRFDSRIFYVAAGPWVDFLLSKQNDIYDQYTDRDITFGFNLTLGLEKSVGKHLHIFFEVHHFNNLKSYRSIGDEFISQSFVNNGIALGLNYRILN